MLLFTFVKNIVLDSMQYYILGQVPIKADFFSSIIFSSSDFYNKNSMMCTSELFDPSSESDFKERSIQVKATTLKLFMDMFSETLQNIVLFTTSLT